MTTVDPYFHVDQDLRKRWRPTDAAMRHAAALLDAEPLADVAIIPMYQPGKTRGVWTIGQEVRTVAGVVFLARDSYTESHDTVPLVAWARETACNLAKAQLNSEPGTVAYAVVFRDNPDNASIFEDIC